MPDVLLNLLANSGPRLHALLTRLTLRADLAEELMQELFLKLSRSSAFAHAKDPDAYAFRAAIHLALDARRRRSKTFAQLPAELVSATIPPLEALARAEQADRTLAALSALSPLAREAAVLHFLEQQSYEQIASQLGKSPHQVRGLCHDALRQLRIRLHATDDRPAKEMSHE